MKKKTYIFLIILFMFFLAGSPNGYAANYLCSKRAFRQTTWVSHRKNIFLADMSANVGSNPKKIAFLLDIFAKREKKEKKKKVYNFLNLYTLRKKYILLIMSVKV